MRPAPKQKFRPVAWAESGGLVPFETALSIMEDHVRLVVDGAPELVWLLEHPPLYTAGTSAKARDLLEPGRFPVHLTGRGGEFTYHGPGQRIVYVMLDVRRRFGNDVRAFVCALEHWLIGTLRTFGIEGATRPNQIGIWVDRKTSTGIAPAKIAAIGLRVRHGVSFHGLSLNVSPNLDHYAGIVPCGIREFAVTSLAELGVATNLKDVDISLKAAFGTIFGPCEEGDDPLAAHEAIAHLDDRTRHAAKTATPGSAES